MIRFHMKYSPARILIALGILAPFGAGAQGAAAALDRTKPPVLAKPPVLVLPSIKTGSLANGVALQLVEQHELPLVQVTLVIAGGSKLDLAAQPGVASFTARMLSEGAGTRDANALVSELTFLGANLFANAGTDAFTISLNVPKKSLGPALDLMADLAQRPMFRAADVKRQRDLRLASILQRRDQPTTLAALAFSQLVFPAGHPYHVPTDGDSASTATLDSAAVRAFFDHSFVPARAKFIVVGDVTVEEATAALTPRFGAWKGAGTPLPMPAVTAKPVVNDAVKVYLVDKPNAAQSVITVGVPGTDRLNPDYPAILVMNTILGGSFSARLMTNLRETKGYTYGINSGFRWAPLPGPFQVASSVRTNVTDSSLVEIFKELRAIRDAPVDTLELKRAKAYIALAFPSRFETNSQIAQNLYDLGQYSLPLSSVSDLVGKVNAVTLADVQRVARKYVAVDNVTLVVVGDLAKVRPGIEALNLGTISVLDPLAIAK
jgi:zinc protease